MTSSISIFHPRETSNWPESQVRCAIRVDSRKEMFEKLVQLAYTSDYSVLRTEKRGSIMEKQEAVLNDTSSSTMNGMQS